MLGYIRERVDGLSKQCQAYRELAGKKQQLLSSFDDLEEKVKQKEIYSQSKNVTFTLQLKSAHHLIYDMQCKVRCQE